MLQKDDKTYQSGLLQQNNITENEPLVNSSNPDSKILNDSDKLQSISQSMNKTEQESGTKIEQTPLNKINSHPLSQDIAPSSISKIAGYQQDSINIDLDPPSNPSIKASAGAKQAGSKEDTTITIEDDDTELSDNDIIEATSTSKYRLYSCLNRLDQNDKYYTSFIQQLEFGCLFELFMLIPTVMYSFIGIAILIMIYSILFSSLLYFINSFLCLIINEAIKRTIKRRRPNLNTIAERMVNLDGILLIKRSSSMPSGDTAQATVFACTMIYTMIWFYGVQDVTWWWMLITIPLVGFERIYFGKHWIGDTLCGAIEGILICAIVCGSIGPYLFFNVSI